jgi:cytoplasmic iron level regulating protein YaaA (DUF328/UPF0246 family)
VIILINSSKTMASLPGREPLQRPALLRQAKDLHEMLKSLSVADLRKKMHLSADLAEATAALIARWNTRPKQQTAAIDAFRGDIYRGLVAESLTEQQRISANETLRILSGLYGILRPFDGIAPYRLELMYSLAPEGYSSLYDFWGKAIARTLPKQGAIVNLASEEYFRVIDRFIDTRRVIEPQFLSRMTPAEEPKFVAVHAKMARGAFARWLIVTGLADPLRFCEFSELGYVYSPVGSTPSQPLFIKG